MIPTMAGSRAYGGPAYYDSHLPVTANLLNLEEADYEPSEETPEERMNRVHIELNNMSMEEKIALGKAMKDEDSPDFPAA